MKIIYHEQTTTYGKTYLYISNGDRTDDVEVIKIPEDYLLPKDYFLINKPFCIRDESVELTSEEENRFYKKALKTDLLKKG